MLTTLLALKAVTEVALLALVGQWILGLLAGARKERNLFYQVLEVVGRPFVWAARRISPQVVLDRHLPLVAFLLLANVWLLLAYLKVVHCLQAGVNACA